MVNYTYLAHYSSAPSFAHGVDLYVDHDAKTNTYRIYCLWFERSKKEPATRIIEISEPLARTIYEIWTNALLEVRYSRRMTLGLDGTTYLFSTWIRGLGTLNGSIWSPDDDLPPLWMVKAGDYLAEYVRNEQRNPAECERYFNDLKGRIFAYYADTRTLKREPNASSVPPATAK